MSNSDSRNSSYACKIVFFRIFLGKGPDQGQVPGLPGHGSEIPDRSITFYTTADEKTYV
jgi:hypothetical protein